MAMSGPGSKPRYAVVYVIPWQVSGTMFVRKAVYETFRQPSQEEAV